MKARKTMRDWLFSATILCAALSGCTSPPDPALRASRGLDISWELLENVAGKDEKCRARFTFVNNDTKVITGDGWSLYFNQATLMPHEMTDSSRGVVSHINGDFYRFSPGPSFSIEPGDSLVFDYEYKGFMIKETDAPCGLYLANSENIENSSETFFPKSYIVKPFDDYNKVFPGMPSLFPLPQNDYLKNSTLSDIPAENLCPIIPTPRKFTRGTGFTGLSDSTVVFYEKGLEREADYIITVAAEFFGGLIRKEEGIKNNPHSISLRFSEISVDNITREAYHLTARKNEGVIIEAADRPGIFYGIQSLLALVPFDEISPQVITVHIPCVEIWDAPRFSYRGFLLDLARNFQDKKTIFKLIDILAYFRINTLDLRLTDDEGWRVEIDGLPELTSVGSRRGHTLSSEKSLPPSFGSGPLPDPSANHGNGFFSRQDYIDIVAYAGNRHVRIIPEICFPSHARAAIVSMEARYRNYMKQGDREKAEEFRLADPADRSVYYSAQMYRDNIACIALPSVYRFYEKVVSELADMHAAAGFPLTMIHTGGDEVPQMAWTGSPLCQNLMNENPDLKNTRHLQAMFFRKTLEILSRHNLAAGGWEEVVLDRSPEGKTLVNTGFTGNNVVAYVWDNTGGNIDLGYRIANAGYPVVLCNVTNLYFDLAYNTHPKEPGLYWGGFQDAMDPFVLAPFNVFNSSVYDDYGNLSVSSDDFSPAEHLKPESEANILGLQAQLWSETVKGPEMMEYYLLPKLFAFAEKAWSAPPAWEKEPSAEKRIREINSAWNEFANRIGKTELPRFDYLFGGFNSRIPPPGAVAEGGIIKANIAFPGLTIRYSTDGSEPGADSPVYTSPFRHEGLVRLKAFSVSGRSSRTISIHVADNQNIAR